MKPLLIKLSKKYRLSRTLHYHYLLIRNRLRLSRRVRPADPHTVLFQAYRGKYACSPKALYEHMMEDKRFSHFTFIWVVDGSEESSKLAHNPRTKTVLARSDAYYRAFTEAKYWVVNIMLPLPIVKRPSQVMIQCWHGTPLKRLRNDIVRDSKNAMNSWQDFVHKNKIDTLRYDYFISPSAFATKTFTSAFGLNKLQDKIKVLELGYPRNDALHSSSPHIVERLKRKLKLPADKKVILYVPTWRDDQHDEHTGYLHLNMLDFDALQQALGHEFVLLFRTHYMIANRFDFEPYKGFIYDVSEYGDVNDLYLVSDVLVTDYSSALFDYANLRKPMLFYMYDQQYYEQKLRGFYDCLQDLPGEIIHSQRRLTQCLQQLATYEKRHRAAYQTFCDKYTYLDDGKATERVVNAVFESKSHPIQPHTTPQESKVQR